MSEQGNVTSSTLLFFTLNREDFSFVIHLDRQPRTSRRREAQTGSRARSGSRSERTLDAVEHSRTLMEWWPFLIFHRGGLRIKVINNTREGFHLTARMVSSLPVKRVPSPTGVVAPLWLRANAPMVVAEVCSTMKYPKRSQYKHAKQKKYHVRNWAEYNEGLRRRGDLTVWFDEEAIANWMADKTGKPGGQRVYSDLAIETSLVVRMVYKLAYRQTEGFLNSIASLLGLGIEIPDYSTLCRRSRLLRKKLRIPKAASSQPIHLMIDSTGLRIHVGTARKPPKQRAWRKLHIAVDRKTGNIVASELTASRARDATRVPALLTQIQAPLVSVAADSAYDKEAVYETIEAHSPGRRTRVVIPPQRNATLSQNSNTAMQERDRHIRAIERHGRREWYKLSGCTKRSMVENAVYRYKAIIGPEMRTRTLARQRVEHRIGCEILNKMTALGMPDTYCAG